MKKTLLLLTLSIACIYAHAQKIDKTLLYGRWDVYSYPMMGQTMYRDSIDRDIKALVLALKDQAGDSSGLVDMINNLFNIHMAFDKDGHVNMYPEANENDLTDPPGATGTYEWTGENKISINVASIPLVLIIIDLTPTKLITEAERMDGKKDGEMTFTRVK